MLNHQIVLQEDELNHNDSIDYESLDKIVTFDQQLHNEEVNDLKRQIVLLQQQV